MCILIASTSSKKKDDNRSEILSLHEEERSVAGDCVFDGDVAADLRGTRRLRHSEQQSIRARRERVTRPQVIELRDLTRAETHCRLRSNLVSGRRIVKRQLQCDWCRVASAGVVNADILQSEVRDH